MRIVRTAILETRNEQDTRFREDVNRLLDLAGTLFTYWDRSRLQQPFRFDPVKAEDITVVQTLLVDARARCRGWVTENQILSCIDTVLTHFTEMKALLEEDCNANSASQ
jgi:hypothetical protein